MVRALFREVERRYPKGSKEQTKAERVAELLVERALEELEHPLMMEDDKVIPQQYRATTLLLSKIVPQAMLVKVHEESQDATGPVFDHEIQLTALPIEDRLTLVAIAQRYALAKGSTGHEPEGVNGGNEEEAGDGSGESSAGPG